MRFDGSFGAAFPRPPGRAAPRRAARAVQEALDDLKAGMPMGAEGVVMDEFMRIVDMGCWQAIEAREA